MTTVYLLERCGVCVPLGMHVDNRSTGGAEPLSQHSYPLQLIYKWIQESHDTLVTETCYWSKALGTYIGHLQSLYF